MKNKAIFRGILGFPMGVFIGYVITIIISLTSAKGNYYPVVPDLIEQCGNEINAVLLQFILSGILGSAFAASSVIWENDNWSIIKQSVVHFLIISFTMFPVAYFAHWIEHSFKGITVYFSLFMVIYIVIWAVQYGFWKYRIRQINDRIKSQSDK